MNDTLLPPEDTQQAGCLPRPGSAKDWPEDFAHENGNYWNECVSCKGMFVGHKRRPTCKDCDTAWRVIWNGMTDEERVNYTHKAAETQGQARSEAELPAPPCSDPNQKTTP